MPTPSKTIGIASCLGAAIFSAGTFAACNSALTTTTPIVRFSDASSDGASVKDNSTQLVWMRCSLGKTWNNETKNCENDDAAPNDYTFAEALAAAPPAGTVDAEGWRLPNKKELASIIDFSCAEPAVNAEIFPATEPAVYWSSTPRVYASSFMAFAIDFSTGAFVDAGLEQQHAVRLVRDPQ